MRVAVDDLVDDWHRTGGRLGYQDAVRLVCKRGLSADQQVAILETLGTLGIDLDAAPGPPSPDRGRMDQSADRSTVTPSSTTQLSDDPIRDYLRRIGRHRLLTATQEVHLGQRIQAGRRAEAALQVIPRGPRDQALRSVAADGRRAHADLVCANLRLVVSIARHPRYRASGLDLADLIQEGNLGLLHAADKFDPTKGFKFSTYATWWIRQGIERGAADTGRVIRLPVHYVEKVNRVRAAGRRLERRQGREVTAQELAEEAGLPRGAVQAILDHSQPVRSLDEPVGPDGDITLGDLLSDSADIDGRHDPVDAVLSSARRRDLRDTMWLLLDQRAVNILIRRYGLDDADPDTLEDIASSHGITRERVRQIQKRSLEILKTSTATRFLYDYLMADTDQDFPVPAAGWAEAQTPCKRDTGPKAAAVRAAKSPLDREEVT